MLGRVPVGVYISVTVAGLLYGMEIYAWGVEEGARGGQSGL